MKIERRWGKDHPGKFEGCPPADHKNRCQGKKRRTRNRCKRWALKGSKYCQFHGGRQKVAKKIMRKRYAKFLGQTLRDKINELSTDPHFDQVNLYDEIAIARLGAIQALKLAEPALLGTHDLKPETIALSLSCLHDAMDRVRDVVVAASKIEKDSDGRVSLRVVDLVIVQIIKTIYKICPDETLAIELEKTIRDTVRLPVIADGSSGAMIAEGVENTPDCIVNEMDASICGD